MTDDQTDPVPVLLNSGDQIANPDIRQAAAATAVTGVKRKNRGNIRKRPAPIDSDEDDKTTQPTTAAIAATAATATTAPRPPKSTAPLAFTTKRDDKIEAFKFESSGTVTVRDDGGATRALETETAFDRDNRAIRERALQQAAEAEGEGKEEGAVYRGMTGYKDYRAGFRRENTVTGQKATGTHGPLRASAHVRMSIRVDYQPDVCKDYKETGYCGWGDSCKFLHDRGDYKMGWEIDREYEQKQKEQREKMLKALENGEEEEEGGEAEGKEGAAPGEELPFACLICRRSWAECQDPVVTRCRHYFCEQCALQHNAKSKKCAVCEELTGGIFNVAHEILKKEKERKNKGGEGEEKEEGGGGGGVWASVS